MKTTAQRINEQLVTLGHTEVPEADFGTPLEDRGSFDSLDTVEVVMSVEEEFGIEIPDEEVDNRPSMNDLVRIVDKYVAEKG